MSIFCMIFQLEMAELNLQQLRSANECNKVDESNQNKEDDTNNRVVADKCLNKENATLKEETEAQRVRINELTLYIQQAAEG